MLIFLNANPKNVLRVQLLEVLVSTDSTTYKERLKEEHTTGNNSFLRMGVVDHNFSQETVFHEGPYNPSQP